MGIVRTRSRSVRSLFSCELRRLVFQHLSQTFNLNYPFFHSRLEITIKRFLLLIPTDSRRRRRISHKHGPRWRRRHLQSLNRPTPIHRNRHPSLFPNYLHIHKPDRPATPYIHITQSSNIKLGICKPHPAKFHPVFFVFFSVAYDVPAQGGAVNSKGAAEDGGGAAGGIVDPAGAGMVVVEAAGYGETRGAYLRGSKD